MRPIQRSQNGLPNLGVILGLNQADLTEWVDKRLSGVDPYLSMDPRVEELPHSVFVWAWEQADPKEPYRERLTRAFLMLLEPALLGRHPVAAEWLHYLLLLGIETKQSFEPTLLIQAFSSGRFTQAEFLFQDIDKLILDALSKQRALVGRQFWKDLLTNTRYTNTCFLALFLAYGIDTAAESFPQLLNIYRAHPSEVPIDGLVFFLVEELGVDRLRAALESRLGPTDLELVYSILARFGITVRDTLSTLPGWELEIRRCFWPTPGTVVPNQSITDHLEDLLRNATDRALAETLFSEALGKIVTEWNPARTYDTVDYTERLLTIVAHFTPPNGLGKVLQLLRLPDISQSLQLKALQVLKEYFPGTPTTSEESESAFSSYVNILHGLLDNLELAPLAAARLLELHKMEADSDDIAYIVYKKSQNLAPLVKALVESSGPGVGRQLAKLDTLCMRISRDVETLFQSFITQDLPDRIATEYWETKSELAKNGEEKYEAQKGRRH